MTEEIRELREPLGDRTSLRELQSAIGAIEDQGMSLAATFEIEQGFMHKRVLVARWVIEECEADDCSLPTDHFDEDSGYPFCAAHSGADREEEKEEAS